MPWLSYSRWEEDDLRAVWLFFHTLEPVVHKIPTTTLSGAAATGTGVVLGEGLFDVYCVICHGEKGSGSSFTTLTLMDVASGKDDANLTKIILEGLPEASMPEFGKTLTDEQIADLVAFIRTWK